MEVRGKLGLAVVQMPFVSSREENIFAVLAALEKASAMGAQVVLLPELFEGRYFCQEKDYALYGEARSLEEDPAVAAIREKAAALDLVVPVSFYERAGMALFNSVAMIDGDRGILGVYRKMHIPDDHFYQEKFYFSPGDTGFRVWDTRYGRIGVGICWDQWFPEAARIMALEGADLLLYPTAIGSEPVLECDSSGHWMRCMCGHAAANLVYVAAANRIGREQVRPSEANNGQDSSLEFYGSSFVADYTGQTLQVAGRDREEILFCTLDLAQARQMRESWGIFRDRRPEAYGRICRY